MGADSASIWTPEEGEVARVSELSGPKPKVRSCRCGKVFYARGEADDRTFARHVSHCEMADAVHQALVAERKAEPLSVSDTEQVAWLKRDAERRRDTTVKGVTGWR